MMLRLWSGCWRKVRSDTRLEARWRYESAATMSISSDAVAVRVLKVLKSVQRVEGMRTLVASLLKCAPLLLQVRRPALARCRVDLA